MSGCALSPKSVARVNREHDTAWTYMATLGGDPSWCRATGMGMMGTMVYFDRRTGEVQDDHRHMWVRTPGWGWTNADPWPNWMLTD